MFPLRLDKFEECFFLCPRKEFLASGTKRLLKQRVAPSIPCPRYSIRQVPQEEAETRMTQGGPFAISLLVGQSLFRNCLGKPS